MIARMSYKYKGIKIEKGVHNSLKVSNSTVIFVDPFRLAKTPDLLGAADIVLCSHDHSDHFSPEDIKKVTSEATELLVGGKVKDEDLSLFNCKVRRVTPGEVFTVDDIKIQTVFAYNVDKFREPGVLYHSKEVGGVGFVFTINGVKMYYAGDTDKIPEIAVLRNIDVAFLPVSGIYVMTPGEAVAVVNALSPKIVVPIHYGEIVGSKKQAEEFKKLCIERCPATEVVIL